MSDTGKSLEARVQREIEAQRAAGQRPTYERLAHDPAALHRDAVLETADERNQPYLRMQARAVNAEAQVSRLRLALRDILMSEGGWADCLNIAERALETQP